MNSIRCLVFVATWLSCACLFAQAPNKSAPGKLELDGAEHRLEKFEQKVERMHGQPFKLGYTENEALKRIAALKDKYPDHPGVNALFERASKAVMASEGKMKDLDKNVLAYRENEKKLKDLFAAEAETQWNAYKQDILAGRNPITKPFPAASHREVLIDRMVGRFVILDGFEYPANEFSDMARQYVFVGTGTRGYYFVELSNRAWLGAYEALKRYKHFVNRDVPEQGKWTIVGKITGLDLIVPQAGKKKTAMAAWGWTVEPEVLYVEGCTLTLADAGLELGGQFAGEERMDEMKGPMYSVREVPDDVTPEQLTEIFATAIKEKNYPLYLECIDPDRRKTPKALSLCMYHWELHQERFAGLYCQVDVGKASIEVVQGFDEGPDNPKARFLTKEQLDEIRRHAPPLIKRAELKTKAFDERGRQYGSPKPRFFKQLGGERWYITDYAQPF